MRLGETSGRLDSTFNPFADEYLGEIFQAVVTAWVRMKQPTSGEIEDRITFRLAGRLNNDPHFRNLPYNIAPQHWLIGMDGERLGRLDLHFIHRHSQRDYFAFEAKRLHVTYSGGTPSTEYQTYISDEGMGAFITGQYSKGLPAAGMLGYVMDGNTQKACAGLAAHIQAKRDDLCLRVASQFVESSLKHHIESSVFDTRLGETQHDLSSHALRLFHLLLPVKRQLS